MEFFPDPSFCFRDHLSLRILDLPDFFLLLLTQSGQFIGSTKIIKKLFFILTSLCTIQKLHATCVVKRFQGPKISPCWWKSILQEVTTALTGRLEELNIAAQPCLKTGK